MRSERRGRYHGDRRTGVSHAEGIDRDPNACEATRLSLALLHLVATGDLPDRDVLRIHNKDAIEAAVAGDMAGRTYGAVTINPPYIKLDHLGLIERDIYRAYLGGRDPGRFDAYVPFVKLCLDLVERGGFVCLVLPQAFLTASKSAALRRRISEETDVRCVVDLTAVPVFEGVGAYTILLVLQRRAENPQAEVRAQVARVTESVGAALQACLDGEEAETPFYSVYGVGQKFFKARDWVLMSPSKLRFDERLKSLPRLSEFMDVKQGFVTGADDVFIISRDNVPAGEEAVFVDYLPDRRIARYQLPPRAERMVFMPYQADAPMADRHVQELYPRTWAYLCQHREKLSTRGSVRVGKLQWWRPERPRSPAVLLQPKIVCPHLMLTPRFAVDMAGALRREPRPVHGGPRPNGPANAVAFPLRGAELLGLQLASADLFFKIQQGLQSPGSSNAQGCARP